MVVDAEGRLHGAHDNAGARGRAHSGRRVKAVKANAALGELVDVRRLDEFSP